MITEDDEQLIEAEIPVEMLEELASRADSMGLSLNEYAASILWQHVISDSIPARLNFHQK